MKAFTDDTIMDFGKYINQPLGKIPRHYLLWLYDHGLQTGPLADYIIDNIPVLRFMRDKQDKAA